MNRYLFFLVIIVLSIASCSKDELSNPLDSKLTSALKAASKTGSIDYFVLPESNDFTNIPADPKNPLSTAKVELGKMLFFETGIALSPAHNFGRGTYSCGSCHIPSAGFMPCRVQGIADGGLGFGHNGEGRTNLAQTYADDELDIQGIRPLSLVNVAFVTNTSWSGQFGGGGANAGTEDQWDKDEMTKVNHLGFMGLESQNMEGVKLHRMEVSKEITDNYGYTSYFDAAFGERPSEERYNLETASLAISAYLRSVISNQAPFQQWLKGRHTAMTDRQKLGAAIFFGKARCFNCHNGTSLNNSEQFYAIGVKDLYEAGGLNTDINDKKNLGRGAFTGQDADLYKFKVPQLYNLKNSPFYFHGSSKHSLREVVEYFNDGIPENANVPEDRIAPFFRPLELTESEIDALVDFLEEGLYDPEMNRHSPDRILSGNCFPNNDPFSRIDLGCE
ncbi:MAG: cytochrome c peroxidase [Bacteroidota bacterium]